jgi:membrane-bound metal-dependent hydrolase YbcI (DUF457 family)
MLAGVGVSAGAYLWYCRATGRGATLGGVLGAALGGGVVALIADVLEPPLHPNHRGFFHSVAALALSTYAGVRPLNDPRSYQGEELLALVCGLAYVSHLLLDGLTPKSLPLV